MKLLLTALGALALSLTGVVAAPAAESGASASGTPQAVTTAAATETADSSASGSEAGLPSAESLMAEELAAHSQQELVWHGLAALYPEKVLTVPPPELPGHSPAPPLKADLPRGVSYLRIYDPSLGLAMLDTVKDPQKLILDLRFCSTPAPKKFLNRLDKLGEERPVIVLVNRRTAGEIEIQLADLQAKKKILTVGTPTAGQTGTYIPVPGMMHFYVLESEMLTADGQSLLGKGLTPSVAVEADPQADYLAYHLVERGTAVESVLQMQFAPRNGSGAETPEKDPATTIDAVLQRGMDVIVALQVMGLLPPS